MALHKVRFVTEGTRTRIFLDDTEVRGCTEAVMSWQPEELPVVWMQIIPREIEVDLENANVVIDKEENTND